MTNRSTSINTLAVLLLVLCSLGASAQIPARSVLVGGGLGLVYQSASGSSRSTFQLSLSPSVGRFVARNFMIGAVGEVAYQYTSQFSSSTNTITVTIGPQMRYYAPISDKAYFFLNGQIEPGYFSLSSSSNTVSGFVAVGQLGLGISLMLNQTAMIDIGLSYTGSYLNPTQSYNAQKINGILFSVGFKNLFNNKKKPTVAHELNIIDDGRK
jgi:Outer membrane protein beta-barrel domain